MSRPHYLAISEAADLGVFGDGDMPGSVRRWCGGGGSAGGGSAARCHTPQANSRPAASTPETAPSHTRTRPKGELCRTAVEGQRPRPRTPSGSWSTGIEKVIVHIDGNPPAQRSRSIGSAMSSCRSWAQCSSAEADRSSARHSGPHHHRYLRFLGSVCRSAQARLRTSDVVSPEFIEPGEHPEQRSTAATRASYCITRVKGGRGRPGRPRAGPLPARPPPRRGGTCGRCRPRSPQRPRAEQGRPAAVRPARRIQPTSRCCVHLPERRQ